MASEQELKKNNPLHKEFQNLLEKDFKDRKLKENEIIKATVTEITKNFVVVDCKAKMEGMIPVEEFKNDEEFNKLKVGSQIDVYLERIESFKGEIIISPLKLSILSRYTSIFDPTFSLDSSSSFLNSSIGIIPSIFALQSTTMKFFVISVTVALIISFSLSFLSLKSFSSRF